MNFRAALLKTLKRTLARTCIEAQLEPALALPVKFRTFLASDYEPCRDIYRRNEPGRFPPGQMGRFEAFLQREAESVIVAELDSRVVGFGGLHRSAPEVAVLCYGMVAPEHQRQRIGATLTFLRLAQLPERSPGYYVFIFAVDASMKVYGRFGFAQVANWLDDQGNRHPAGALPVSDVTLANIKATLRKRGIRLEGTLALPMTARGVQVEQTRSGPRFRFGNQQPGAGGAT